RNWRAKKAGHESMAVWESGRESRYLPPMDILRTLTSLPRPALKTPNMPGSGVYRSSTARYYLHESPMCQIYSGPVTVGTGRWAGRRAERRFPARDRPGRPLEFPLLVLHVHRHHRIAVTVSCFIPPGSEL